MSTTVPPLITPQYDNGMSLTICLSKAMVLVRVFKLGPAKKVKNSDRELKQALALYEGYQAKMNKYDRILAQDSLMYSGDLRYGFEDKYLITRVRQARLYCNRVAETLRIIKMAVEKAIDMRAREQFEVPVSLTYHPHVGFGVRELEEQLGKTEQQLSQSWTGGVSLRAVEVLVSPLTVQ